MPLNNHNNYQYIASLQEELKYFRAEDKSFDELDDIALLRGQAAYVMNYQKNEVVYTKYIKELLGYDSSEFNSKMINHDLFHPKQRLIISLLISSAVKLGIAGDYNESPDVRFTLLYKAKHKNGSYKSILRQTGIYEKDDKERMISVFSVLTDVSGVMESEKVEWKLEGVSKNFESIMKKKLSEEVQSVFTQSEINILKYLKKGLTTRQIARELHNSEYTISTHRRNMLNKSNCKNARELLNFAESLGIQ